MGLRDLGATLPPGFRFYPSDEELVCHYLYKKVSNEEVLKGTLVEIDLHTIEPWQLPDVAKLNATEWYFFSFRDRKYATGYRTNRATTSGYWKATGKDRTVMDPATGEIVGMRKTLVFYRNRAPNGIKTGWIMHEFRLETPHMPPKEDWVLCRVFHKGKGENNNTNNNLMDYQQNMFEETTATIDHFHHSSPPNHKTTTSSIPLSSSSCEDHYQPQFTSILPPPQPPQLHHQNIPPLLSTTTTTTTSCFTDHEMDSKGDRYADYGFLWDMNLDETTSLGDDDGVILPAAASNFLEDMRFEVDNSIVFF